MLVDASRIAIVAVLPLGFFAVGAALAEEAEEGALPSRPRSTPPVAATVALRLLVAPALLFLLALAADRPPGPYLLLAAMPCGINSMIVTHAYGLDLRISAAAIAWSTDRCCGNRAHLTPDLSVTSRSPEKPRQGGGAGIPGQHFQVGDREAALGPPLSHSCLTPLPTDRPGSCR